MRAFRFRLRPLLQAKRRARDDAAREVARVRNELTATREALNRSRRERLEYDEQTLHQSSKGLSAAEFLERRAISEVLNHQIQMAEHRMECLDQTLRYKETQWKMCRREFRTMENLQEKQHRRWMEKNRKEEQSLADEAGTIGYRRRTAEHGGVLKSVIPLLGTVALAAVVLLGIRAASQRQRDLIDPDRLGGGLRSSGSKSVTGKATVSEATAEITEATTPTKWEKRELQISAADLADTLRRIQEQQERLRRWEERLKAREQRLERWSRDLEERRAEMEGTRNHVENLLDEVRQVSTYIDSEEEQRQEEHLKKMVRLYEAMNPRSAAPLLLEMDFELAQRILSMMNTRKSVRVIEALGKLNVKEANELVRAMTEEGGDLPTAGVDG